MHAHSRHWLPIVLTVVLASSLVLSGCCGPLQGLRGAAVDTAKTKAAEALTKVPEVLETKATDDSETEAPEAEETEAAEASTEATSEPTAAEKLLDNLVKLAPVHIKSTYVSKNGDDVVHEGSLEGDMDAAGNQHLFFASDGGTPTELYLIDGALYIQSEEGGQFIKMEDFDTGESAFSFIALYGGAYMLAFNDLEEARLVGSESVNGYNTKKYEFQYDLGDLGALGLAAGAEGAAWDYHNYAWVEVNHQAIVKGEVAWAAKDANATEVDAYSATFDVTPGSVAKIEPPENVLDLSAMLTPEATAEESSEE